MAKTFTERDFSNRRGYQELTQGEKKVTDMVIDFANESQSKSIAFNKTRRFALNNMSNKTIEGYMKFCIGAGKGKLNARIVEMGLVAMTSKLLRDYVTIEMSYAFKENVLLRCERLGEDGAVNSIKQYLSSDRYVAVAQTYREVLEENEKEQVIYFEPKEY